jgi:hypothetical protein
MLTTQGASDADNAGGQYVPGSSLRGRRVGVSSDGRYFVLDDGSPFFYLADTAWTIFKRLTREEIDQYLENRARKGFTVIQAYVVRGLALANRYGERPLMGYDPCALNEGFFSHVDYVVRTANDKGLVMALVPTFGEHVQAGKLFTARGRQNEAIFTRENAYRFGALLGERYRDECVMWLLGGDRNPIRNLQVWQRMAEGLKDACRGSHLVSFHGPGHTSSSYWFHDQDWLDFNTIQSAHERDVPNYVYVAHDRCLTPVKPTMDIEARYENHRDMGPLPGTVIDAHQVRTAGYWAMLAGAAGHGYGENDVRQFARDDDMLTIDDYSHPSLPPTTSWQVAMDLPGAWGMMWLRRCMERYPWHRLEPIRYAPGSDSAGSEEYVACARDINGEFAVAYLTGHGHVNVRLSALGIDAGSLSVFNPRTGEETKIGDLPTGGDGAIPLPDSDATADWVVVVRQ